MEDIDNILALIEGYNPPRMLQGVAQRVRTRRLELNLTQQALARKAGVSLASYRRFETTGDIAFRSLVQLAIALDAADEILQLFTRRQYSSIDEALAAEEAKKRKRGTRNE